MIGPGEREVRYEVQIQRLLRRQDADQRRIVCLSAILPDGDQLDDFSAWLRAISPAGPSSTTGSAIMSEGREFQEIAHCGGQVIFTVDGGDEAARQ